ncbi:MAG: efflux RND transporter periplasmic adaptor subunit [Ignavibacteriaceae bacterium]|nr:efflux RND transporter periplasmic adaptor subunit [Ignavibacteriaceae bacterium]
MKYLMMLAAALILAGCSNSDSRNSIEVNGTLESTEVTLSAQSAGEIINLMTDEGLKVSEGDTLIMIDNSSLLLQLQRAEALVEISKAQYDLLVKGARSEDLKIVEEQFNQASYNYEQAKRDKERGDNLVKTGSITQKQYEDLKLRLEVASSQYTSAKNNLEKIKNIARPEEVRQAAAKLKEATANAEIIKNAIGKTYVVSPISGVVVKKFINRGEVVNMLTSLIKISDLSSLDLIVYIRGEDLGLVKLGQKAELEIDSYPGRKYEGNITYISSEASFTPKNIQTKDERTKLVYKVKVKVNNPAGELKDGMPADAKIIL